MDLALERGANALHLPVVTSMLQRRWEIKSVMRLGVDGMLVNDLRQISGDRS